MRQAAPKSYAAQGLSLPGPRGLTRSFRASAPISRGIRADDTGDVATNTYNFSTPAPDSVNAGMGNYFESLRVSKDRTLVPYAMVHMRPQILRLLNGLNRKLLACIGRYLMDNGGVPAHAVNLIANYSTPVRPHSLAADKTAAGILDEYFKQWAKQCDFTRRFNYWDLQTIQSIAIDTDGDISQTIQVRNGFPYLRMFDTLHIGTLTGLDPQDGVVVDDYGVLKGYRIVDGPVETLQSIANVFYPVEKIHLLRDPARYDNYRGFSPIRRGSNNIRDKDDILAFVKLKTKISAALAAVIQQQGTIEEDIWGDDTGPQGFNQSVAGDTNAIPQEQKISLAELLGGDIPVIAGELKQLEQKAPDVNTIDFLEHLAGEFVAGLDLPPAFFLDKKLTGPNVRLVLNKAQKKFNKRRAVMAQAAEWVWLRIIGWGIEHDGLPAPPDWTKVGFHFPPLITIDLGDVANGERADVMSSQMTERERYENRGKDRTDEAAQIELELDDKLQTATRLVEKYKQYNVPIGPILTRLGFGQVSSSGGAPAKEPDGDEKKDGQDKEEKEEATK